MGCALFQLQLRSSRAVVDGGGRVRIFTRSLCDQFFFLFLQISIAPTRFPFKRRLLRLSALTLLEWRVHFGGTTY